jgi:hypothetical protein
VDYTEKAAAFGGLTYLGGESPNDLVCQECVFHQKVDVEDNNMVIMELEGGIKVSYSLCHFTPYYHRNYMFNGSEGRNGEFRTRGEDLGEYASVQHSSGAVRPGVRDQEGARTHGGAPMQVKELALR